MAIVTFGQPLWSQWAIAAVEQRVEAAQGRADLVRAWPADDLWHLPSQRELRRSMQSIVAAAFALEGWAFSHVVHESRQPSLGASGVIRALGNHYVMDRGSRKDLVLRIEELFNVHRGELAHHKAPSRAGVIHPILGSTPYESATYTIETANWACETLRTMVEVTLRCPNQDRPPPTDVARHARIVADEVGW